VAGNDIAMLKVENMALAADNKATDARRVAEMALMQQSNHEQLCGERYGHINTQLAQISKIYDSINELRAVASKAIGAWLALAGLSAVLGAVYVAVKLTSGG
jgi:hypothetical protein